MYVINWASYNSVIFETVGANMVEFKDISSEFFTTALNTTFRPNGHEEMGGLLLDGNEALADLLSNGNYLNRTRFENITATECNRRYAAPFITSGNGFRVRRPGDGTISNMVGHRGYGELIQYMGSGEFACKS
jgi:hypothetical protein